MALMVACWLRWAHRKVLCQEIKNLNFFDRVIGIEPLDQRVAIEGVRHIKFL